jgi:hypothetical protein
VLFRVPCRLGQFWAGWGWLVDFSDLSENLTFVFKIVILYYENTLKQKTKKRFKNGEQKILRLGD